MIKVFHDEVKVGIDQQIITIFGNIHVPFNRISLFSIPFQMQNNIAALLCLFESSSKKVFNSGKSIQTTMK